MRNLGQLEALVMDRLWSDEGPLSVRQVLEGLPDDRHRAYTTVMTVLDNLFRKGLADRERAGRAYVYRPRQTREQHTADLMESVLAGGGDRGAALMHFVEQLQPDEAEQLRALLTQMDKPPKATVRGRPGKRGRKEADPS
jgi:predicted transcriptional regulator